MPVAALPRDLLWQSSVTVVVWRLKDPGGIELKCVLTSTSPDRCDLRVEWGNEPITTEQYSSVEAAFARADAMWIEYLLDGWGEA